MESYRKMCEPRWLHGGKLIIIFATLVVSTILYQYFIQGDTVNNFPRHPNLHINITGSTHSKYFNDFAPDITEALVAFIHDHWLETQYVL